MKKPVYLLLGILLIFVIIYLLLIQKEKKTFSPGRVENFLQLDSAAVDRIQFRRFDSQLVLQRINQRWYMVEPDSHRADNDAVGKLLSLASHLDVGDIISSNPGKQFWFQVDSLTGITLEFLSNGKPLVSVVAGKTSDDLMHGYLRKRGSDEVYLADVMFVRMVQRNVDPWKDRRIFTFDPGQIREIELSYQKDKFKLVKDDTLWQLSRHPYQKRSPAESQAVENYLQTLASLKADGIPFKSQTEGLVFETREPVLKLTFQDGRRERLFAIQSAHEESRYFVKTDQEKSIFVLFEYSFKRLTQKPEDFQPKDES